MLRSQNIEIEARPSPMQYELQMPDTTPSTLLKAPQWTSHHRQCGAWSEVKCGSHPTLSIKRVATAVRAQDRTDGQLLHGPASSPCPLFPLHSTASDRRFRLCLGQMQAQFPKLPRPALQRWCGDTDACE